MLFNNNYYIQKLIGLKILIHSFSPNNTMHLLLLFLVGGFADLAHSFDSALFDAIDAGKTAEALELLETVEHPDKYETFTKDK